MELTTSQAAVTAAVAAVVANSSSVARLLRDLDAARQTVVACRRVLEVIGGSKLPESAQHYWADRDVPVDATLELKWRQAIDALATDAYVALPE